MEKLKLEKMCFALLILQMGLLQLSCNTTDPPLTTRHPHDELNSAYSDFYQDFYIYSG